MYGDHDWMDPAGAHRAAAGMAERRAAAGPGDQQVITVKVGKESIISMEVINNSSLVL